MASVTLLARTFWRCVVCSQLVHNRLRPCLVSRCASCTAQNLHARLPPARQAAPGPPPTRACLPCSPELAAQWGYSLTTGGRAYMEDYHTAEAAETAAGEPVGLFAVYDGHGGRHCVRFIRSRIFAAVLAQPAFAKGDVLAAMHAAFLEARAPPAAACWALCTRRTALCGLHLCKRMRHRLATATCCSCTVHMPTTGDAQ
jgi:Protein phosphatase 2C